MMSNPRSALSGCLSVFVVAFTLLAACPQAHAMSARTIQSVPLAGDGDSPFSIRFSTGVLNGESRELVFMNNGHYKVSELIWRLDDVPVIGVSASARLPLDIILSAGIWSQVTNPSSYMEDFDWDNTIHPTAWTHFSRTNTKLDRGEMADANLLIPLLTGEHVSLSGIAGLRMDHWKWTDGAGYYIYSSNPGWRDVTGTFPDEPGIIYEQWFMAPYIGGQIEGRIGDFTLSGRIAGSRWAWAKDKDMHLNTGSTYRDYFYNIPYITMGGEASWLMNDSVSLSLSVDGQRYFKTLGYTKEDYPGGKAVYENGAGIEHQSWMSTISLEFRF